MKRFILPALFVFAAGTFIGARVGGVFSQPDTLEQLRKLEDAFLLIDRNYVEKVSPVNLVDRSISAMLEELDPHSSYIDKEQVAKVQEGYRGSFGGIGIWFEAPPEDTARVTSIIADGPSEKVGLMPGDLIIAVDDSSVVGYNSIEIQNRIKGPIGTDVELDVVRRGVDEPVEFVITRGEIPLYSIDTSYMMDDETGYLRIGRFAMTTHQEFLQHTRALIDQGMQRMVLDLRDNPGGIKQTAVLIADEFLPGGHTIVYTKGRVERESERDVSTDGGLFENGPVIVLVNENTASGSEIISGALQDHDRALVVGRRTFGKGLVQRPFQLRDGSILQLTVSRYYMPSGRLIQTAYEDGSLEDYYTSKFGSLRQATYNVSEYLDDLPDSLRFKTTHGRTVFGGGGVMPDIVIAPDSVGGMNAPILRAIVRQGADVRFAREWFLEREAAFRGTWMERQDEFVDSYAVPESFMEGFWDYAEGVGISITDGDSRAEDGVFSAEDLAESEALLRTVLKARLAQRLYGSEAWFPIFNAIDPTVLKAQGMWTDAAELAALPPAEDAETRGD
ncbi:MAG: S41 family peptidase [Rhodothermales bacterium]|nr:S41 family peptidase [Rhodothermales bacterium]MBO6778216.1 S41 family peptidase [Rhodothermales bacterium]